MPVKPVQQLLLAIAFVFGLPFRSVWSAELIPVRATYSSIGGAFAPLWLAQDKGLFAKHGLAVELKYILSATGTQALFAGSVDIVNPATEIIEAGLGGQQVALSSVFSIARCSRFIASRISNSSADLRGKSHGGYLAGIDYRSTAKILFSRPAWRPARTCR